MSQHQDAHSNAHHDAGNPHEWMAKHLGGIIMPFGERAEKVLERFLFLMLNNFFRRAAFLYIVIAGPLLLVEFLFRFVGA